MPPVRSEKPISLEEWREFVRSVDPDTTFHGNATASQSPVEIPARLQAIFEDFGAQVLAATFAVRHGVVEGAWIDPQHNYIATVFRKSAGDDDLDRPW